MSGSICPGAAFVTELSLPRFNFGALTRVRAGGRGLPFSGGGDEGAERFTLWASHTLPILNIGASVNYQVGRRTLSCTVGRQVFGPINAQFGRSWDFSGMGAMTSIAALFDGPNLLVSKNRIWGLCFVAAQGKESGHGRKRLSSEPVRDGDSGSYC